MSNFSDHVAVYASKHAAQVALPVYGSAIQKSRATFAIQRQIEFAAFMGFQAAIDALEGYLPPSELKKTSLIYLKRLKGTP